LRSNAKTNEPGAYPPIFSPMLYSLRLCPFHKSKRTSPKLGTSTTVTRCRSSPMPTRMPWHLQLEPTSRKNKEVLKAEIMLPWTPRRPLSRFLATNPASQLHHLPIVFNLPPLIYASYSCANGGIKTFATFDPLALFCEYPTRLALQADRYRFARRRSGPQCQDQMTWSSSCLLELLDQALCHTRR
jgi:hypothetical protein